MLFVAKVVERQPSLIPLSRRCRRACHHRPAASSKRTCRHSVQQSTAGCPSGPPSCSGSCRCPYLWRRERDEARQRILAQGVDASPEAAKLEATPTCIWSVPASWIFTALVVTMLSDPCKALSASCFQYFFIFLKSKFIILHLLLDSL